MKKDIKVLHACSLLRIIGFKGEVKKEVQIVTEHLNIRWDDFLYCKKKN